MADHPQVVLQARTQEISDMVLACAKKELPFSDLCREVAKRGYKTTSLYEMVIAAEYELKQKRNT